MSVDRRQSYRVVYPQPARPTFVAGGARYVVADVSEHGLRFLAAGDDGPQLGDDVAGVLTLASGQELRVEGTVVRATSAEVAVRLATRITFAAILAEQRFLRMKYPMWNSNDT